MSYGLSVVNDSGSVVVDNRYKVMVFSERGDLRVVSRHSDTMGSGTINFLYPVLTEEPPQIFLRYVSGNHAGLGLYITMVGGVGRWTGFTLTSAVQSGKDVQNYLLEYVVCKYSDRLGPSGFGLDVFDEQGGVVYSSSDRPVRYSKFAKRWTFVSGVYVDAYDSGLAIDDDDFVCVSAMDLGIMWFAGHSYYCGITLLSGGRRVLIIHNDKVKGDWLYQGVGDTCFAIPVCKFPVSKYYS